MSIFLAIPSYCDSSLKHTLASAYDRAKYKDRLFFGIVDQCSITDPSPIPKQIPLKQVSYLRINQTESKGCCWARSLVSTLYRDEDWYLQLDSHMLFSDNWDCILLGKMQALQLIDSKPVISSYPIGFKFVNGLAQPNSTCDVLNTVIVKSESSLSTDKIDIRFKSKIVTDKEYIIGHTVAGGCMFVSGSILKQIPIDPYMYFGQEEICMSVKLYTNGWNIYHVKNTPIYHLYNDSQTGAITRPLHWDKDRIYLNKPTWWQLNDRANGRMNTLLSNNHKELGIYGLGQIRTLQQYSDRFGIDYINRTIKPDAFNDALLSNI